MSGPDVLPTQGKPQHYEALDLLRGVAALIVCVYHVRFLLFSDAKLFSSGYLCVDLFFLLSGFVIAANYDGKIARGLSFRAFFVERLARLYPLFAAATLLGFAAVNLQQFAKQGGLVDQDKVVLTLITNLAMIPSFFPPWDVRSLFPFNGASWSIFYELWVNIVFFLCWRFMDMDRLLKLVIGSAVALVVMGIVHATLDLGWGAPNFGEGFIRVTFSFFAGVAIYRLGITRLVRSGPVFITTALLLLVLVLNGRLLLPEPWSVANDLLAVVVVFPIVLVLMSGMTLPRPLARIGAVLGGASYSIYLLHTPLVIIASGLPQMLYDRKIAEFAPVAGLVFVPLVVLIAYLTWRYFELPAKTWLRRWLNPPAPAFGGLRP